LRAALEVDQRAQGDVEVEVAALLLIADAHFFLRLDEVEQPFELLGQRGVFQQQLVDVGGIALGMQGFVDAGPVGSIGLAGVVPFGIVARRQ
jgi:hypothetical protein